MLSREDFEKLIDALSEKLDDTTVALVSEELLNIKSAYTNGIDEYDKIVAERDKINGEKDELLKVNGKLYQKIGFDKVEEEKKEDKEDDIEEIKIEDVIDEKGDLI